MESNTTAHESARDSECVCILGLPIDVMDVDQAVARVLEAVRTRQKCFISTPNLNFLINARKDASFRDSVLRSDLSLADGVSLLALARLMGMRLPERVSGADLFATLCNTPRSQPVRIFFLGGPAGAAAKAHDNINRTARGAVCVGYDEAGFGDVESMSDQSLIDKINRCAPDFVVVSLGAAKGQAWIMRNRQRLEAPVISHLGAVVNFTAGTIRRAPRWIQRMSLEWLWRAVTETGLARRYWDDGRAFVRILTSKWLEGAFTASGTSTAATKGSMIGRFIDSAAEAEITISGQWQRADQITLEARLHGLIGPDVKQVRIDASDLSTLDAYTIGTLARLHGQLLNRGGAGLTIRAAKPELSRLLTRHDAGYLLG
jgi:N-acetylglucosaminyldiphosphoundecaprenol N-acetyl-beta-D-mannosaminyltransferase